MPGMGALVVWLVFYCVSTILGGAINGESGATYLFVMGALNINRMDM